MPWSTSSASACSAWLAALTAHIPNAGEHLVRYYGWYSNVTRGKRRKAQGEEASRIEDFSELAPSEAKRACLRRARPRRARLIKQVYEVDPLFCLEFLSPPVSPPPASPPDRARPHEARKGFTRGSIR